MAEEFARCLDSIIRLFFAVCLQFFIEKLKVVAIASFLNANRRRFKES